MQRYNNPEDVSLNATTPAHLIMEGRALNKLESVVQAPLEPGISPPVQFCAGIADHVRLVCNAERNRRLDLGEKVFPDLEVREALIVAHVENENQPLGEDLAVSADNHKRAPKRWAMPITLQYMQLE